MVSELALFEDKILGIRVKGVTGTNSARIKEADGNDDIQHGERRIRKREWSISAEGSNIETVFNIPGVDFKRTVTNNVMADRLGIEAARNVLLTELPFRTTHLRIDTCLYWWTSCPEWKGDARPRHTMNYPTSALQPRFVRRNGHKSGERRNAANDRTTVSANIMWSGGPLWNRRHDPVAG
jgi:hypothetical protein